MKKAYLGLWSALLTVGLVLGNAGCASQPKAVPFSGIVLPRSIMVMPPLNHSVELMAPFIFMASVSQPIAEKGYYVFPVAVVEQLMRNNGLPTTGEMNNISLEKIRNIVGADAVLYTVIEDWGQKYEIIQTRSVVRAKLNLVDSASGESIWHGVAHATRQSGQSNQGLLGSVIFAAIEQIANTLDDQTFEMSKEASANLIGGSGGLPDGPLRAGNW